ncbi:MAG: GAF domain-containing protein [Pseudomonadota bacterium]
MSESQAGPGPEQAADELARLRQEIGARDRELAEARQQQSAMAEVLKAISSSDFDLQAVLNAVVESAARLCGASFGQLYRWDGTLLHWAAGYALTPEFFETQRHRTYQLGRDSLSGRTALNRRVTVIDDAWEDPEYGYKEHARIGNFRTMLGVPLLRSGDLIGVLGLVHQHVEPFTERQIELVTAFADQAVIAIGNARLVETLQSRNQELTEALEQQTATGTILRAIAASPTDIGPVLDIVAERAAKLCEAYDAAILLAEGDALALRAHHGPIPIDFQTWPPGRDWVTGRAYVDRKPVHVHDLSQEEAEFPAGHAMAMRLGHRTIFAVPLLREDKAIGALVIRRREVRPFSRKQIDLLILFADQAAIAIENARLFEELQGRNRELTEAMEREMATGAILRAIAASPTDVGPVLDTVAESAARLCDARDAAIVLAEGDALVLRAHHGPIPIDFSKWPIGRDWVTGRAYIDRKPIHVHDIMQEGDDFLASREAAERLGFRTILGVPMLREGKAIGAVLIRRDEVRPFSQKQIDLLIIFADQAAIAIENVRLFEEVKARTGELSESLQQQIATADVLKAISRSTFDLNAVLNTLVESAARLCGANIAQIFRWDGACLRWAAGYALGPEYLEIQRERTYRLGRGSLVGRTALDKRNTIIRDVLEDPEYAYKDHAKIGEIRTLLGVPLLRSGELIGVIALAHQRVEPFTEKQIELVTTFADQAVIAIENVRLFEEVQARTRELQETLDYQTAIGEVLNVISRSPSDVQPVLDVILQTAVRLCDADGGTIARERGGVFFRSGQIGFSPEFTELMLREPVAPTRSTITGRTLVEGRVVQIDDAETDPEYTWKEAQKLGGLRTLLGVPLLRDKTTIGVIALIRRTVRPFTEKQIELVTTFADQAVIAIENARLFEEVQARTADLARSVDELQALGEVSRSVNSTLDLKTVLETIVAKAVQLSGTEAGAIYVYSAGADRFRLRATYGMSAELIAAISDQAIRLNDPGMGDAARSRQPVQTEDLAGNIPTEVHRIVLEAGFRSVLVVPLLRPNKVVGALVVRRRAPGRFSDSTVRLMETFAAQSVLAIQNARMFSEIEEKGRQLEIASRHKSQFLANMSHELRTPLNSVLGFSEMLADGLYGELPEKAKATLGRVQANGRHLLGLINDVLDLSKIEAGQLTLSIEDYAIGQVVRTVAATTEPLARAKGLTLRTTIAEGLPLGRGDERRLSQVLLNLAGNAVKFTESGAVEIAATSQDGCFEILVRDTGPGIAPEHQARIFEEFQQVDDSSTRSKGGTGLGLAISKRIVEMHGGTITVDSVLGAGSTFRVSIPMKADEGLAAA